MVKLIVGKKDSCYSKKKTIPGVKPEIKVWQHRNLSTQQIPLTRKKYTVKPKKVISKHHVSIRRRLAALGANTVAHLGSIPSPPANTRRWQQATSPQQLSVHQVFSVIALFDQSRQHRAHPQTATPLTHRQLARNAMHFVEMARHVDKQRTDQEQAHRQSSQIL